MMKGARNAVLCGAHLLQVLYDPHRVRGPVPFGEHLDLRANPCLCVGPLYVLDHALAVLVNVCGVASVLIPYV